MERVFDRRIPTDWKHVEKYPLRLSGRPELTETVEHVERVLDIPRQYRQAYDQGMEGACVGFSQSWMMSILNRKLYAARTLYKAAQEIDEWDDTPPADGTSLRAGFDVLRVKGHWRFYAGKERAVKADEGIKSNRWATRVDEIRTAIANGIPVNLGIAWFESFNNPEQLPRRDDVGQVVSGGKRFDYWIARQAFWGPVVGGHAITAVAASDMRQAIALCNTWGESYPFLVWVPYQSVEEMLAENGEAGIVEDRIKGEEA